MRKLIFIPAVAAFAVAACAERADDSTLETEDMRDGTVTSDTMPDQPVLTDPVPGTLPDADRPLDGTDPEGTEQDRLADEPMTPEEKPMRDGRTDQ